MNKKAQYYFEGAFRKVKDYIYCYRSFAKGRWLGKRILETFSEEFKALPQEYYVNP